MSEQKWPTNRIVSLLCGCMQITLTELPPKVGDDLYCARHHSLQWITEVDTEYRVKCLNCSVSKPFGLAKLAAQLFADQHHRRQPLHTVHVRKGSEVMEVRAPRVVMETLPFDAPFLVDKH